MKKISILFLILLCNCTFLYAQQFSITGVVTDKKLNEPIIGASVTLKKKKYRKIIKHDEKIFL